MKQIGKTIVIFLTLMLCVCQAEAQSSDSEFGVFDHLGAGVSVGTDGIGIDLATPMTDYAARRAGVAFWPKLSAPAAASQAVLYSLPEPLLPQAGNYGEGNKFIVSNSNVDVAYNGKDCNLETPDHHQRQQQPEVGRGAHAEAAVK